MLIELAAVERMIDKAYDDAKADIVYAIEHDPAQRPALLAQLDVLNKVKERLNARISYSDPTGNG